MKTMTLRRALTAGMAGLAAFALAACTAAPAGQTPAPEATDGASGPERASIRLIIGPVFYEPIRIAEEQGFFEEQNLDVTVIEGGTASENAAQLIAGQADIAMSGGVSVIQGAVEGLGIRTILGGTSSDPDVATSGLVALPSSGLKSYADLGGKTVALQGLNETTHLGTLLGAKEAGVDTSTITFVQLPLPNLNDAVLSGEVDAAYPIGVFYGAGLEAGLEVFGTPSSDVLAYGPSVVHAATDKYVEENEDVVKRYQAAVIKAAEFGRADNFAAIRDIQLKFTKQDPEYIKTATLAGYQTDLYRSGFQATLDGMYEFGFITKKLTIDDVISPIAPLVD